MGSPLPVPLASRGGLEWREAEVFFFLLLPFFPPFLLPFCSSVMEGVSGLMRQYLKPQCFQPVKKSKFHTCTLH